jgi:colanic acid biosynthesis glycosyl transferase WcaI
MRKPDDMKVRVLLLNQTYLPDPAAASPYLARWAEDLAREGHDITVLASRHDGQDPLARHPAHEVREGVKVVRVAGERMAGRTQIGRLLGLVNLLFCVLLRGFFLPKPDVIVALTSTPFLPAIAAILAWMRGTRLLVWATDLYPETAVAAGLMSDRGVIARVARLISRRSLRRADRVITLDDAMRRKLFLLGVEPDRVEVVPLWMQGDIAFDTIGRANLRRSRGWDHKFVVMCAGNHGAYHSMDTMLAAADALRDDPGIHFCWVGGGSQWPALQGYAARNVSLIGYVPREKLSALLSAADLHVVVMGDAFAGLVHPGKVYNILAAKRPFIHIGPEKSPIAEVIRTARLGEAACSFRNGDRVPVAREIRRRAKGLGALWPLDADLSSWQESVVLKKMNSVLEGVFHVPTFVHEAPVRADLRPQYAGLAVSAPVEATAHHRG